MYYFTSRFRITSEPKANEKVLEERTYLAQILKPRDLIVFSKNWYDTPKIVFNSNLLNRYYDDDGKEQIVIDSQIAIIWRKNKHNNYVKIWERKDD